MSYKKSSMFSATKRSRFEHKKSRSEMVAKVGLLACLLFTALWGVSALSGSSLFRSPPSRKTLNSNRVQIPPNASGGENTANTVEKKNGLPTIYGFEIVKDYPHDSDAFTQGLQFEKKCELNGKCNNVLWESTGLNGESSVRMSILETGEVVKKTSLEWKHFGEGLVKLDGKIYQVTWQKPLGFLYDPNLNKLGEFTTPLTDGWGLTTDGVDIVISDGSTDVYFLDPANYSIKRKITVKDGDREIRWVNELEWIDGEIWANIWQTNCIARIDPETGNVNGWVLMHKMRQDLRNLRIPQKRPMDVLNGIAWDDEKRRIFVTGKLWPRLYEINVFPVSVPEQNLDGIRKSCIR